MTFLCFSNMQECYQLSEFCIPMLVLVVDYVNNSELELLLAIQLKYKVP